MEIDLDMYVCMHACMYVYYILVIYLNSWWKTSKNGDIMIGKYIWRGVESNKDILITWLQKRQLVIARRIHGKT
jgi:hypothetical protein